LKIKKGKETEKENSGMPYSEQEKLNARERQNYYKQDVKRLNARKAVKDK
jgi:hypothetical protein